MTPLDAALMYASMGWAVLPVVQNGKTPATLHGVKDATTDERQIRQWWTANPNQNIGIATGKISGIVVFDVDPRNGGTDSWDDWQAQHGAVPDGIMQMTAGGGAHHLAVYQSEIRSCKLCAGVDLLSDGRYFVAYPSSIEGRQYQWEASSDPMDGVAPFHVPEPWMSAYRELRKPVARLTQDGGHLIQGNRNAGLTSLGGAMRNFGMQASEIMAALSIANETRCDIPLPHSELSQIVRSVMRYEPEADVAAAASLGADIADQLEAREQAEREAYYFERASSLMSQPAPLRWIIKGWLPDAALAMVYGESGAGKTFVMLDMACCIASGMPWHGRTTRQGVVVYMAGEGNYGLRQRITAWHRQHGGQPGGQGGPNLDGLLISNKAIDLDGGPHISSQIIHAVQLLTREPVSLIIVDTVNNHMAGDENSAKDTRTLLNACAVVARTFSASVCLCHHTGHAAESKQRARGSSAWKASLDAAVLVSAERGGITVACTKMKDAEPPEGLYGRLEPVVLIDWLDEDTQEPVRGAVFVPDDTPQPAKMTREEQRLESNRHTFAHAWYEGGDGQFRDGKPYLSRKAFLTYLMEKGVKGKAGMTEASAAQYLKASAKGKPIHDLIEAGWIEVCEEGWRAIQAEQVFPDMDINADRRNQA